MRHRYIRVVSLVGAALVTAAVAGAAVVALIDFEGFAYGTSFGSTATTAAGSQIFVVNDVQVSIHPFSPIGGAATTYGDAIIQPATSGKAMRLNNVNLRFDVAQQDYRVVTVEFFENGGGLNIAVNGGAIQRWKIATPPAAVAAGVRMFVARTSLPAPSGASTGTILLLGDVRNFTIGGQELVIDNISFQD